MDLTKFYDDLKSELDNGRSPVAAGPALSTPTGELSWRTKANQASQKLSDDCRKHILLDIYCKVIPLDADYVQNNMGVLKGDIDNMLAGKGMTATQYFKSCSDATKAPLVEFVIRTTNNIGKQFLEEANEDLKDAKDNNIDVPAPDAPDIDEDENVTNQLVDIKDDPEYQTFIDILKEKTIKKIVKDVSEIINDKKEDNAMAFDPKPVSERVEMTESTTSVALQYLQKKMITEGVDISGELLDDMMGMAIRESTLNMIDSMFKLPGSDFKSYNSRIKFNKGIVVNESAANYFIEAANEGKSPEEVNKVVDGAKKEMDDKIDQNLKASEVINAAEKGKENKDQK